MVQYVLVLSMFSLTPHVFSIFCFCQFWNNIYECAYWTDWESYSLAHAQTPAPLTMYTGVTLYPSATNRTSHVHVTTPTCRCLSIDVATPTSLLT